MKILCHPSMLWGLIHHFSLNLFIFKESYNELFFHHLIFTQAFRILKKLGNHLLTISLILLFLNFLDSLLLFQLYFFDLLHNFNFLLWLYLFLFLFRNYIINRFGILLFILFLSLPLLVIVHILHLCPCALPNLINIILFNIDFLLCDGHDG